MRTKFTKGDYIKVVGHKTFAGLTGSVVKSWITVNSNVEMVQFEVDEFEKDNAAFLFFRDNNSNLCINLMSKYIELVGFTGTVEESESAFDDIHSALRKWLSGN